MLRQIEGLLLASSYVDHVAISPSSCVVISPSSCVVISPSSCVAGGLVTDTTVYLGSLELDTDFHDHYMGS